MREPSFLSATLFTLSGLSIWAGHFLFAYGLTGLICARPAWAEAQLFGAPLLPLAIILGTLFALAAIAAVLMAALAHREPVKVRLGPFLRALTLGVAALALVGIAWNGLPVLFMAACRQPG